MDSPGQMRCGAMATAADAAPVARTFVTVDAVVLGLLEPREPGQGAP